MKRTGVDSTLIDITGYALALYYPSNQPVRVTMDDTEFLLLCSTKEKLEEWLARLNIIGVVLKKVDEPWEFLRSIPIPVMLDPWITPEGKIRFTLVLPPPGELN